MTATPESPPPVDATDPIDAAREAAEVELLRSAIKTVVQMAVTGADLDAPRNYVAITLTGMRTPFDRAEVHLIRPGGSTPHEARGLAVARAVLAEARADAAHQIADEALDLVSGAIEHVLGDRHAADLSTACSALRVRLDALEAKP